MNPVLIILIILAAIILWFLCSFSFKSIGSIASSLYNDAKDAMTEEEKEDKE